MITLKIHSLVDVITNSSTTIYTYHDGCIVPAKELIAEIIKHLGETRTVDELFNFKIVDPYGDEEELEEDEEELDENDLEDDDDDEDQHDAVLRIYVKDSKYEWLAQKIEAVIGGVSSEEGCN